MWFKKLFILVFCGVFINLAQAEHTFKDTHKQSMSLSASKGKWIVVNYWAPWCPSCMQEVPELNSFYENNHDKNVVLYGVNYDNPTAPDLEETVEKANISFPVLLDDPNYIWRLGQIEVVPTTFIISPNGKVVKKFSGPVSERKLASTLRNLQEKMG